MMRWMLGFVAFLLMVLVSASAHAATQEDAEAELESADAAGSNANGYQVQAYDDLTGANLAFIYATQNLYPTWKQQCNGGNEDYGKINKFLDTETELDFAYTAQNLGDYSWDRGASDNSEGMSCMELEDWQGAYNAFHSAIPEFDQAAARYGLSITDTANGLEILMPVIAQMEADLAGP